MTLISRRPRRLEWIVAAAFFVLMTMTCTQAQTKQESTQMDTTNKTLWEIIDILEQAQPFSKEIIESIFGTPMFLEHQTPYATRWKSGEGVFPEASHITHIELSLNETGQFDPTSHIALYTAGCLTRQNIAARYPDIRIVGMPRGQSPQETTDFASLQPWAALLFSFREANRECLARVIIAPPETWKERWEKGGVPQL